MSNPADKIEDVIADRVAGHAQAASLRASAPHVRSHLCDEECGDESHPRDGRVTSTSDDAEDPLAALVAALLHAVAAMEDAEAQPVIECGVRWTLAGENAEQTQATCCECTWSARGANEAELVPQVRAHVDTCQPTPLMGICASIRRVVEQYEQARRDSRLRMIVNLMHLKTMRSVVIELARGYGIHKCVECDALAVPQDQRPGTAGGRPGRTCERHAGPAEPQPDGERAAGGRSPHG